MRLDKFLSENSIVDSRTKSKKLILASMVSVNRLIITDPNYNVSVSDNIEINEENYISKYVSRGSLKLIKAIEAFKLDINDKVCLDLGASTGGFTDVLIKNGAKIVYAVDVGKDQLHESIRSSNKVISLESFDARNITKDTFNESFDIITSDLSFISLKLLIPAFNSVVNSSSNLVVLIKPQFESGKIRRKNGIFNDINLHINAINNIISCFKEHDLYLNNICKSPIKGGEGNIEYLALFRREDIDKTFDIRNLVKESLSRWTYAK